ncbi:MAG TPA: hypothetical protein VGM99_06230 [Candidatus Cybelea sp.]
MHEPAYWKALVATLVVLVPLTLFLRLFIRMPGAVWVLLLALTALAMSVVDLYADAQRLARRRYDRERARAQVTKFCGGGRLNGKGPRLQESALMKSATIVTIAILCALCTPCGASSLPPIDSTLLPMSAVLDLTAVRTYFPAVTRLAQTGAGTTAQETATPTRSVFYENGSGSKRVTISVDRYGSAADAASAYAVARKKSSEVPGFKSIKVPNLGQRTFAGIVTIKGETHIGLGALSGNFVVGATLAGFDTSSATVSKLVSMSRAEVALLTP